jgi:single-stranded-DNA-specific exonuclease
MGIRWATASVLAGRGILDAEAGARFLTPRLADLNDPLAMRDMHIAVARTVAALGQVEPICVYGDYDADGMTATALLATVLARLGANVSTFIPERMEDGYGLAGDRLRDLASNGCRLVIAVDCGIRSHAEIADARTVGLDVVVLDHHEPEATIPDAVAVVNPHRVDCQFPFKGLAAVGIAFYFAGALRRALADAGTLDVAALDIRELLDLVAVGTIADVVPLVEDNRIFAAAGLKRLNENPRIGLAALKAVAGVAGKPVTSGTVGFQIAPRINAAGRLGNPRVGLDLLMAVDAEESKRHAEALDRENDARRVVCQKVLEEAIQRVEEGGGPQHRIVVSAGEGWHPGVVGIVASRLVDAYQCPAVVIGIENGIGRGSCRSIRGFDIARALESLSPMLVRSGGHPMAAGLTIRTEHLGEFTAALEALADREVPQEALAPRLNLDAIIPTGEVDRVLADEIARTQPWGMGNPEPVFGIRGVYVDDVRTVGKDRTHATMLVSDATGRLEGIWFGGADAAPQIGHCVDVAFSVILDERTGLARMKIRDVRPADTAEGGGA